MVNFAVVEVGDMVCSNRIDRCGWRPNRVGLNDNRILVCGDWIQIIWYQLGVE